MHRPSDLLNAPRASNLSPEFVRAGESVRFRLCRRSRRESRRLYLITVVLALPVALLSATPAQAAEPVGAEVPPAATRGADVGGDGPGPVDDDLIREEQTQELEKKKEALEDDLLEREAATEPETTYIPLIGRDRWIYEWRNGSHLSRKDGLLELHFGGQGQLDGGGFHLDGGLDETTQRGWDSKVDFRRLRLYAQGFVLSKFMFRAAYDFEDAELKEGLIGLRGLGRLGAVRIGYMKEPFSLEDATSLRNQVFMERSLANALVPGRNTGVLVSKTLFDQRLHAAVGAFFLSKSLNEKDDTDGLNNDWEITLRASGLPFISDDGNDLVVLGFSYAHTFTNADDVSLDSRPESSLVVPLLDASPIRDLDDTDRFGVEASWLRSSLSLQAEVLGQVIGRQSEPDLFFWGGYAQASYFLTGERRTYGRASGAFGRVIPSSPFRPSAGQWGAFEVAARVSTIDLTDEEIRGGQQTNLTLGINWYLLSNLRMSANYVHGRVYGQGDVDVLQARLQLDL